MTPTPDITRLRSLLERCEAAEGPDRELDLDLARTLAPDVIVSRQRQDDTGADPYTYWHYTGAIAAAVALIEKKLPGVNVAMGWGEPHRNPWATISPLEADGRHPHSAGGYNQALALLSALLQALLAREEQRAGEEKEDSQCAS
ncbi:hypothetical protein IHQ56_14290 [Methylobacillus flagellatus]|uniref:hypothetical protein n=1 Tax=Methylobacillus flagellatus TaxID=405 RepID=UPI002853CFB2|nr:hypothetical protein [Methylobacillus flagellatus]MDR5172978.1 hypothetical protein [Methylobacillus flagellatus]